MSMKKIAILGSLSVLAIGLASWGVRARAASSTPLYPAFEQLEGVEVGPPPAAMTATTAAAWQALEPSLICVEQYSTGSTGCQDSGGFDSRCAVAKCGAGYKLTGGGGACNAGNRNLKSAIPNSSTGEFHVMCDDQGVSPKAKAICCKIGVQLQ